MKNNTVNIAFAAFFSFVSAVVYIVMYIIGLLPNIAVIANIGIVTAIIVLVTISVAVAKQHYKNGASLYNTFNCYGSALVWAATVCLCLCILFIGFFSTNTVLVTILLFIVILSWKFMIILWALFLCGAMPCNRYTQNNCGNSF